MLEDVFVQVFGNTHGPKILGVLIYGMLGLIGFKIAWYIMWRIVECESNYRWGYTKACADYLDDPGGFEKRARKIAGREEA